MWTKFPLEVEEGRLAVWERPRDAVVQAMALLGDLKAGDLQTLPVADPLASHGEVSPRLDELPRQVEAVLIRLGFDVEVTAELSRGLTSPVLATLRIAGMHLGKPWSARFDVVAVGRRFELYPS
jgi:hypothetical protein